MFFSGLDRIAQTYGSFRPCGWSIAATAESHRFYGVTSRVFILNAVRLLHQKRWSTFSPPELVQLSWPRFSWEFCWIFRIALWLSLNLVCTARLNNVLDRIACVFLDALWQSQQKIFILDKRHHSILLEVYRIFLCIVWKQLYKISNVLILFNT